MQIRRTTLDAIAAGAVTVAFRRWARPMVAPGSTQRTPVGVVEFTSVEPVDPAELTEADSLAAGYPDLDALLAADRGDRQLYRVGLRLAGPDPRVALRARSRLSVTARTEVDARLARLDKASKRGSWTATVLALIGENPGVRAPDLAASLGLETLPFKRDVRKLKELGLTESLEVGYRLSPRGRAYRRGATPPASRAPRGTGTTARRTGD